MSFLTTQPEALSAAAHDLACIGAAMRALNDASAALTTSMPPAAADGVSATTALRFAYHANMYQLVSAQAAAIHDQFVAALASGGGSYAATEAGNAAATGI